MIYCVLGEEMLLYLRNIVTQPDHVLVTGPQPHGAGLRPSGVTHCQLPGDYTGIVRI